jgi:hypothetical protein
MDVLQVAVLKVELVPLHVVSVVFCTVMHTLSNCNKAGDAV